MKYPCDDVPRASRESSKAACDPRWTLAATILGSSMAFIDGTVVNVALPVMQSRFRADAADALWVVEAYALFLSALILTGGAMGDHYGRRRIYAIGTALFAFASVLCGIAPTIRFLIYARGLQGVGAALLVPGSLALIGANYEGESRGRAIGMWSGFTGITSAIGPALGGYLVQHLSWRSVFFLNLPLAAVVLALVFTRVPESTGGNSKQRLDYPGAWLITAALGSVVFAFISAPRGRWSRPTAYGPLLASLAFMALLLWRERRDPNPLVPFRLFRSRDFSGANLLTLTLYAALGAMLYFLPFDLIQVQGYTPTQAGLANLPFIFLLFLLSRWAGGISARIGARLPLAVGSVVTAIGFLLLARAAQGGPYWTNVFPAVLVLGFGMSGVVSPLTTTVMNSVSESQAGTASGINNAVSRIASLLAIAVLGLVVSSVFASHLRQELDRVDLSFETKDLILGQQDRLAAIEVPRDLSPRQQQQARSAIQDAFVAGFRRVMLVSAALAGVSGIIVLLFIGDKQTPEHARTS